MTQEVALHVKTNIELEQGKASAERVIGLMKIEVSGRHCDSCTVLLWACE